MRWNEQVTVVIEHREVCGSSRTAIDMLNNTEEKARTTREELK